MNSSSAKFPDLGVRSPAFLTKKWPLKILPIFLTCSRLIWQSFFHNIKNHRHTCTSPTGHQRPSFAVGKIKISPVVPPFGLSPLLGIFVSGCGVHSPDLSTPRVRFSLFFLPKLSLYWDSHPYSYETSIFTLGAPHEEVQGRQTKLVLPSHASPGISFLRDSHIVSFCPNNFNDVLQNLLIGQCMDIPVVYFHFFAFSYKK